MSDGGNNRSEMNRLEQALAAWLEFREAGSQTPEEFLTEHDDPEAVVAIGEIDAAPARDGHSTIRAGLE